MKKVERLDEATAPDGTVLTLYRHDGAYYIRASGVELMSTRRHHSEELLGERACAPLAGVPGARVLIGGLGFGYTLRAALRTLPGTAELTVVELVDAVIRWNLDPAYELAGAALQDPRVSLLHDDVARVLAASAGAFDAIILDVDNGADALTTQRNARLYRESGIRSAIRALRPGGRLAYWAAAAEPAFEETLRRAGLRVESTTAGAYASGRPRHVIYVAQRAPSR
jgi:spermidine synthase